MATYSTPAVNVDASIAYNTANLGTGIAIATLAPDDLLERIWVEVTTVWNSATSATLTVGIADDDLNPVQPLATYNLKTATAATADFAPAAETATLGTAMAGRAITSAVVYARNVDVGAPSAGVARIHSLIRRADAGAAYVVPAQPVGVVDKGEVAGVI